MVDRMNGAKFWRKTECEGSSAGLGNNLVGTEEFVGELLGRTSGAEELSLDVGLVANLELWRRKAVSIGRLLVSLLSVSDVVLEMFVKVA